jgi:hypothetical protein
LVAAYSKPNRDDGGDVNEEGGEERQSECISMFERSELAFSPMMALLMETRG